jgi:hypothetical protein
MREPTSLAVRWSWWESALAGNRQVTEEYAPQCGFYKVRKWSRGPFVPARLWMEMQEVCPETGELMSDETFAAEIDGWPVEPWSSWTWLAKHPATEAEYDWTRAQSPLLSPTCPKGFRPWWELSRNPPF